MERRIGLDISSSREQVARALIALETRMARLVEALAHRACTAWVEGVSAERAIRHLCEAYSAMQYGMEDAVGASVVCVGVVGVPVDVMQRARAVNAAKSALKSVCAPLQRVRMRVPVKGAEGPTKALPVIRVILRSLQRSDLNLLAAYRKIPILDAPPASVVYTRARTRAVYRKSVEEVHALLAHLDGPTAVADRARLGNLDREVKVLALVREHYENLRANVVHARLDRRGRGRMQIAAELPLMYAIGRGVAPPRIQFPGPETEETGRPRRTRVSKLEPHPLLQSLPVFRYASSARSRRR